MKNFWKIGMAMLLAAAVSVSFAGCSGGSNESKDSGTEKPTETAGTQEFVPPAEGSEQQHPDPVVTDDKGTDTDVYIVTPGGDETDTGTDTDTEPDTEPVTPDTDDVPGEGDDNKDPEEDTPAGEVYAKGRFTSDVSPKIALLLDWELAKRTDGKVDMKVSASLSCYAITANEKVGINILKVGDTEKKFTSPQIEYDGASRKTIPLAAETFVLEGNEEYLPVSAEWQMLGVYGGMEIKTLTAKGVIDLLDLPEEWLVNP